jgi:uracil permease
MFEKIKEHLKHASMGLEHLAVALTSVLFVSSLLGYSPRTVFLAVGIGTLIFHKLTDNKLSTVLGISASYLGGMLLIKDQLGIEYVAFGILGIGIIYTGLGLLLFKYPKLLSKIPRYIFKLSVVFIALILIPIGWGMANSPLGFMTLGILALFYAIPKTRDYTLPLSLIVMSTFAYFNGQWGEPTQMGTIALTVPAFSFKALTTISLVSLAVLGEVFGDVTATAELNEVALGEDLKWRKVFLGLGLANIVTSFFASPVVSYSENNGFLASIGKRDLNPTAQVYTAILFIGMAFIPWLPEFLSSIPFPIFGALLLFLFLNLGFKMILAIDFTAKKAQVSVLSLGALILTYTSTVVSPITAAFGVALLSDYMITKSGEHED